MSTPAHTGAPLGGDPVNDPKDRKPKKSRSYFDLSYKFATTLRFGEISPFLYVPCVPDSNKTVRSSHLLRSLSLTSPLLQNLRIKKDFVAVPRRALLPRTWDLIYTNPTRGEDINALQANTIMPASEIISKVFAYENALLDANGNVWQGLDPTDLMASHAFQFKFLYGLTLHLIGLEALFAKDSLFATFREPLNVDYYYNGMVHISSNERLAATWKAWHDVLTAISAVGKVRVDFSDTVSKVYDFGKAGYEDYSERMRFYYDVVEDNILKDMGFAGIVTPSLQDVTDINAALIQAHTDLNTANSTYLVQEFAYKYDPSWNSDVKGVNWAPVLSYQMSCVEFYTNDHVDDMYSVDIFRGLYEALGMSATFMVNGIDQKYDGLSYAALKTWINGSITWGEDLFAYHGNPSAAIRIAAMFALITRRRSLRFVDYFVGARTQPLAVYKAGSLSDVEATVNNNKVSAIDITKSIQAQRFLNQINHVGRRAKDYLKGLFGIEPMDRTDVPVLLGTVTESIYGIETQNTADAQTREQNSITTNFQSSANNFAFEFSSREESIVIGLCYFDIARFYDRSFSRLNSQVDRYDMYNPYFQFIGDQPIYLREYDSAGDSSVMSESRLFGYTARNQEYKTLTDYCTGDFVGDINENDANQNSGLLKSWIFKNQYAIQSPHIGPEFIRAQQTELDRYYVAHTGTTPNERYNFIVMFTNHINASEPMSFNPQILG